MFKTLILISSIVGLSGALSLPSNYDYQIDNAVETENSFINSQEYSEYAYTYTDNNNIHYVYAPRLNSVRVYAQVSGIDYMNDLDFIYRINSYSTNTNNDLLSISISNSYVLGNSTYYPIIQIYTDNTHFIRINLGVSSSHDYLEYQFYCVNADFVENKYLFINSTTQLYYSFEVLDKNYETDGLLFDFDEIVGFSFSIRSNQALLESTIGTTAYDNGYNAGYENGKEYGFELGQNEDTTITNLFFTIADIPIRTIYSLFSFDLFGMSVFVAIISIITLMLVVFIIRKVI